MLGFPEIIEKKEMNFVWNSIFLNLGPIINGNFLRNSFQGLSDQNYIFL